MCIFFAGYAFEIWLSSKIFLNDFFAAFEQAALISGPGPSFISIVNTDLQVYII